MRLAAGPMMVAAVLMLAAALSDGAAAQNVGNVDAVNPRSTGTPPGASERSLTIGTSVRHREVVRTSGDGTAQITFNDKTTLSVGRNSTVTIDKFVYDPQTNAGQMATTFTKGVMRFIGGEVSHHSGATITTPVAAIGVRGASLTVQFKGKGIIVIAHYGTIDVANDVSRQRILRPGYAVIVTGRGDVIGAPFPVSSTTLAQAFALLTSAHGQHGGAVHLPTDALAARYGLGQGRLPNDPGMTPGWDVIGIMNTGDSFVANRSQQLQFNNTYAPVRPPAAPAAPTTQTTTNQNTPTTTTTTTTTVPRTVTPRTFFNNLFLVP
ncbi:MAG: FecR domain-containing protein [Methylovirgula sp.]